MIKDLKFFMRKKEAEIITALGPDSILGEDGNPLPFEIKVLTNTEIQKINENYRKRSIALDKKGNPFIAGGEVVFKTERDNARAVRHMIADALIYPNLKDEKLMEYYNCHDITEMPLLVFPRSDEYAHVTNIIMSALGMGGDTSEAETLAVAKN